MEQESIKTEHVPRPRPWQYSLRTLLLVVTLVAIVLAGGKAWYHYYMKWKYPYGWSHCCDKALMLALLNYADAHGGNFPTGGATPEASLSLLYPHYLDAETLRGKTVPLKIVENLLQNGKPLGPTTCGWHYVDEGLTLSDDPEIALVWDKIGLDHNGGRLSEGGHSVIFIHDTKEITEKEWPDFLKKQKTLLAARKRKSVSSTPPNKNSVVGSGSP
ncbi:MAG: hypothetical protein JXB10_12605 [Pirellulales bacterium]|nr:hypothetical protein [Pirellulales bacterium]